MRRCYTGFVILPFLTATLPGTGGVLRTTVDDFVVDEEPAYQPSGQGDHVFVRIEKRALTTPHAVERIAKALGIAARDIGVAGMKDRQAVTRQWLSLPPPITPELAQALAVADVTILAAVRHPHKLRTGHVRANRFRIRIRGSDHADQARAILEALAIAPGAPNWYGEQRFGNAGDNAARGRAILLGERQRDRRLARLLVSALQSELFNAWLTARLADGLYAHVVTGDILHKQGGGQFTCDDATTDDARLAAGELVVTGPMFGASMRCPPEGTPAAEREAAILAAAELTRDSFASVRAIAEGTRRDASIAVGDWSVSELEPGVIEVCFTLPGGAYATTILREIMKSS